MKEWEKAKSYKKSRERVNTHDDRIEGIVAGQGCCWCRITFAREMYVTRSGRPPRPYPLIQSSRYRALPQQLDTLFCSKTWGEGRGARNGFSSWFFLPYLALVRILDCWSVCCLFVASMYPPVGLVSLLDSQLALCSLILYIYMLAFLLGRLSI